MTTEDLPLLPRVGTRQCLPFPPHKARSPRGKPSTFEVSIAEPTAASHPPTATEMATSANKPAAPPVRFREARYSDVPEIGRLYAAAFSNNPAYGEIFPASSFPPDRKASALLWLFERRAWLLLYCNLPVLVGVVERDDGVGTIVESVVAACALTEKARKPGKCSMIMSGILWWPWKWGFKSLQTALDWEKRIGSVGDAELVMVAVVPEMHGQGVGTQLVRRLLEDHEARFDQLTLNTQAESNVAFYTRFGFKVVSQSPADAGYTNWLMARDQPQGGRQQPGDKKKR